MIKEFYLILRQTTSQNISPSMIKSYGAISRLSILSAT